MKLADLLRGLVVDHVFAAERAPSGRILLGDVRERLRDLPDESVHCVVTSPPYFGLRDYGVAGQIGLEPTPEAFVEEIVGVFREVRRVLRSNGTLWLNLGDSYANDGKWGGHSGGKHARALHGSPIGRNKRYTGLKPKDRIMIPARSALALQADGWWLRDEIIWHKPNPMPHPVTDRTTSAHEMIYLLTKSARYHFDHEAIREAAAVPTWEDGTRVFGGANKAGANAKHGERTTGRRTSPRKRGVPPRHAAYVSSDQSGLDTVPRGAGRNKRSVWTVAPRPFKEAHFATFPPQLIEPCILAGCPAGGVVLDPFFGAGTTGLVAQQLGRNWIGIELNPEYVAIAERRLGLRQQVAA